MMELPFDVTQLEFEYGMVHSHPRFDEDRFVVRWAVDAVLRGDEGDTADRLAYAHVVMVDMTDAVESGEGLFEVLDNLDADSSTIGGTIFDIDANALTDDLAGLLEMHYGTVVILDRVWVDPRFRGHGIGPLLAATALWTFRHDCCLMACYPSPFEDKEELSQVDHQVAVEALGRVWAKVGFQPFRGGVWIMDPARTVQGNARQRLLDGKTMS
jgi:GNAT superfamily N-acetyltransferase